MEPDEALEAERLAALASYDLCGTEPEEVFDDLVRLAARVTATNFAAIVLVDSDTAWYVAVYGETIRSLPRCETLCGQLVADSTDVMIVPDLAADPRFPKARSVSWDGYRAYMGVPIVDRQGYRLGSLCVLNASTRCFQPDAVETLKTVARAVAANFELRRALRVADDAARTDTLTGLANRRTALAAIDAWSQAGRPIVAIAIDLDFFKEVNDSAGHEAGDLLLRETASRLLGLVRGCDLVARWGGDEFLILIPDATDRDSIGGLASRISARMHVPVRRGEDLLRLGATLGIAALPGDVQEPGTLVRLADEAMLRAKQEKRGSIGWAAREDVSKLATATTVICAFEADIAASGRVEHAWAALQPIVSLRRAGAPQRLLAVEVLARWTHPCLGVMSPDQLFGLLGPERSQILTEAVLQEALAAFLRLRDGMEGARLAINLSAAEVMHAETAARLTDLVQRAGLTMTDIELEITEEVLLERVSDRALEQLAGLRARGARLVLDDFGTGNSGLSQLLRLPLDGLKLDKQFVHRLGTDPRADEIVRATASLAAGLNLDMVAEGVETPEQAARLERLGFRAVQGYLFGKPMTAAAFGDWLEGMTAERGRLTVLRRRV